MREVSLRFNDRLNHVVGLARQDVIQKFLNRGPCGPSEQERRRMDVDLTLRYSDDRLCEVVVCRPNDGTALYRIVTRPPDLAGSLTEAMREARRLYAGTPWPDRRRRYDA
jgi:hypothetical protein